MLNNSPTLSHFVEFAASFLTLNGFHELKESDNWSTIPSNFFVVRSSRSIIAVTHSDFTSGLVVGSYIDYPCFQLQSNSHRSSGNLDEVRVSPYGRTTWFEWLDRRLGAAGRALCRQDRSIKSRLFRLPKPVGIIPSLAPHLNRHFLLQPNFNLDKHFKVVLNLTCDGPAPPAAESPLLKQRIAEALCAAPEDVLDYDVTFFDANPVQRIGIKKSLIAGERLSILTVPLIALRAFVAEPPQSGLNAIAFFDDGFAPAGRTGVESNFLKSVLERIGAPDSFLQRSIFVAADAWDTPGVFVDGPPGLAQAALALVPGVGRSESRNRAAPAIDRAAAEALGVRTLRAGIGVQGRLNLRELVRVEDMQLCAELFVRIFKELHQ
jgi:aspartyl aminopeptidase